MKTNYQHTLYACYLGYVTQAVVNNFAPLLFLIFQDSLGLPLEKITMLITVNFCVQLTVDILSAKFVDRLGYRPCAVAAHLFSAAGLAGMGLLPRLLPDAYAGLLVSVVLYAVGGGLIEVLISPIVEACPTERKAAAMSFLHSFYCWGAVTVVLLSTGFLAVLGKGSWPVLCCLWALLPLLNAFFFTRVPIASLTGESGGMGLGELFRSGLFWLFFLLMITAGASELAMSQWASAFAERGLGVTKAVGDLAGPCFFALLMGTARASYAKAEARFPLRTALPASGALCVGAYLLAVLSPSPALSLLGCGLCGFSVGILWPGVFSLASARFPRGGTAMFALLALGGDIGCTAGPTLVGLAAGAAGGALKVGLAAAIVFPAVLTLVTVLLRRR